MSNLETQAIVPAAPRTLEAAELSLDLVHQLVLKSLHFAGELTGTELAARLGVLFAVLQPSIDALKRERQLEVSGSGTGPQSYGPQSYPYRLTDTGHARAAAYAERSSYVGKLPVALKQYTDYMYRFGKSNSIAITQQAVREALKDLVLSDRVLDQLGPGIAARHSVFIYGPPGNGKTEIAHRIASLLGGDIAIPHALAIDNEIVSLYDPINHEAVETTEAPSSLTRETVDDRWIRCKRPVVSVGGELRLAALDLGYNPQSGLYRVPVQALANGGLFVIDDFGRQRVSPRELLNRWIVPLQSRSDHLVLQSGQKFEIPFETLVVFATNMNPLELLDESFLRRIRYKVHAESPTHDQFTRIFAKCCADRGLDFDPELVDTLIATELQPRKIQLRGCQPRDLIEHALMLAEYTNQPKALTRELMSAACATYFLSDDEKAGK